MSESLIYLRSSGPGYTRSLIDDITDVQNDLLDTVTKRLRDTSLQSRDVNQQLKARRVQEVLSPEELPKRIVKFWNQAEDRLWMAVGTTGDPLEEKGLEHKIGEFLIPKLPFSDPEAALHHMHAMSTAVEQIRGLEYTDTLKPLAIAKRALLLSRIFKRGFYISQWLAVPPEIPESELASLVSLDPKSESLKTPSGNLWVIGIASSKAEPQIPVLTHDDALDNSNPNKFSLARLQHFAKVSALGTGLPGWQHQSRRATFTAFTDCLDLGLGE